MEKSTLYPLTFKTIFKDKIWGGQKIRTELGKDFGELPNCGETWEVSGVEGNISVVKNGALADSSLRDLIDQYKGELVGERVYEAFGSEFPLLIKFIDANDDLSVQVHPDDEVAMKKHHSFGKTEMWYVMQADEGSSLISGFNQTITKEEYLNKFNEGKLMDILNREEVNAGDVFFLPAGRVHTIGKGLLIAEIQQTSDITYRIYDFDRVDANGKGRELHFEDAIEVMDFQKHDQYKTPYQEQPDKRNLLVTNKYFNTTKLSLTKEMPVDLSDVDSFKIYICLDGKFSLRYGEEDYSFGKGDAVLVPAVVRNYSIKPISDAVSLLETYVP